LGQPPALRLSTRDTALIVVDMQYFDAHPDWGEGRTAKELGVASRFADYFAQIDEIVPRIRQLLDIFRSKEMEVIHLHVAELTKDSRDVGWKQLVRGLVVPCDSREAEFLDELRPIDDELIISKSSSGVFPVTNLDRLLRNLGLKILVFAGTSTGGCVESAVRDAVDLGYDVVVASDASADTTLKDHEDALRRMQGGLTRVMSTNELAEIVGGLPREPESRSGVTRVRSYVPTSLPQVVDPDANPYDLIFGPAVELPLTRANTALVLVDAQRLTCDPGSGLGRLAGPDQAVVGAYYERVQTALVGMTQILATSRATGLPVIHVRTAGQLPDGRDLSRKTRAQGIHVWTGSREAEFMPAVSPGPGEIQLNKPGSGSFTGTGLDELLRNLAIEHVILAGVSYDGSVEASIRSAGDRGYGVVVIPDACATYSTVEQQQLWTLESGTVLVASAAQIIERLRGLED
jgi:nicotinamidase-related amidase